MLYYSKITNTNPKEKAHALFIAAGADEESVILDDSPIQKRNDSLYERLKTVLKTRDSTLVIDSLQSLGKNNREISKELQWFYDNNIHLVILDLPSTFHDTIPPITLLSELYTHLASKEIQNVKRNQRLGIEKSRNQNKPLGRKRIPYPEHWDFLYKQWEKKEITPDEFMKATGLKKGTLYNLIKQYKEQLVIEKQA